MPICDQSSGSDQDYEHPEEKMGEENYICPFFVPQTAEEGGRSESNDKNNLVPEVSLKPTQSLTVWDCHRGNREQRKRAHTT